MTYEHHIQSTAEEKYSASSFVKLRWNKETKRLDSGIATFRKTTDLDPFRIVKHVETYPIWAQKTNTANQVELLRHLNWSFLLIKIETLG